ncbi:WD repeat-containing protein 43 [Ricinus communis]|uniref:WD repeat-containing protein 43 n=1 Tax=Ricinus communis TaxID=3988 RepID=UPI00201AF133|nr:WD repeat-containing protein 43 [Ricinus communis]
MAKEKLKSLITAFTSDGDFLAILYPTGSIKIWSTGNGSLLAEWKQSDDDSVSYSCMACSFVGKKRKQEHSTFLLALGTHGGDILATDAFTGDMKWKSSGHHPGGVIGLAFANKGRSLRSVGTNGKASEMNSKSGELTVEFKASKRPISSLAFSSDEEVLAAVSSRARLLSLVNGKELFKFPDDLGTVQHISISKSAKNIVTTGFGEKILHLWRCNLSSKSLSAGPVLSMRHPPLVIECKSTGDEKEEDGLIVLSVSESGVVYVWNLKTSSQDEVNPTKITVKGSKSETNQHNGDYSKKHRPSILAAQLHDIKDDKQFTVVIAYGPIDYPKFRTVNVTNSGENILVNDTDVTETVRENGISKDSNYLESEATIASTLKKKTKKKRAASEMDPSAPGDVDTENGEAMNGVLVEDDVNEPTMGEKLASLNLQDNDKTKDQEKPESPPHAKPPSADSVNILLKQALHAEDRALLLDCLYTQNEKVIANSISQLNPSDVHRLLNSLLTIIDSRGAILACALPWLKVLLLQHASGIMSQDSSLVALNSLYQIIESRVSTFPSALQLSSYLDFLYAEVVDDISEETETIIPVIYEDKDESDEDDIDGQESEEAMETDQESEDEEEAFGGLSDLEGGDDMSE